MTVERAIPRIDLVGVDLLRKVSLPIISGSPIYSYATKRARSPKLNRSAQLIFLYCLKR